MECCPETKEKLLRQLPSIYRMIQTVQRRVRKMWHPVYKEVKFPICMLVYTKTSLGIYQCPKCYREFSRSDSLRRHASSGDCKEDSTDMTDSEESMDSSSSHDQPPFGKGEDVFGKYDEDDLEWTEEESDDVMLMLMMQMRTASRRKRNP